MMNFHKANQSHQVLSKIMSLIDENHLHESFDRPILEAASKFDSRNTKFTDYKSLIAFAGSFVRWIFISGVRPPVNLSRIEAKAEALELIILTGNFDKIYLKAVSEPESDLEFILEIITTKIIEKRRKDYIQKVLIEYIPPFESRLNFELTKILIEELRPYFPDRLKNLPVYSFTSKLQELILAKSKERATLQEMLERGDIIKEFQ